MNVCSDPVDGLRCQKGMKLPLKLKLAGFFFSRAIPKDMEMHGLVQRGLSFLQGALDQVSGKKLDFWTPTNKNQ